MGLDFHMSKHASSYGWHMLKPEKVMFCSCFRLTFSFTGKLYIDKAAFA